MHKLSLHCLVTGSGFCLQSQESPSNLFPKFKSAVPVRSGSAKPFTATECAATECVTTECVATECVATECVCVCAFFTTL